MERQCKTCKITKSINEFSKRKEGQWRWECKKCRSQKESERRKQNLELFRQKDAQYYEKNKSQLLERNKQYRIDNRDAICLQKKDYYQKNKEAIQEYHSKRKDIRNEYVKQRARENGTIRLRNALRSRIYDILKNKRGSAMKYVECDLQFLIEWFEFQFTDEMTWDNFGTFWDHDHVTPIASFDLTKDDQVKICFNWKNLQPLSKAKNMEKSDKINLEMIANHKQKVLEFQAFKQDTKRE